MEIAMCKEAMEYFEELLLKEMQTKGYDVQPEYNDDEHRYYVGPRTYRSATQIVHQFVNVFDTPERALYMANRYGRTPEFWTEKWKEQNRDSIIRGNELHKKKEDFLHRTETDFVNKSIFQVRPIMNWKGIPYYNLPDGTYPEMMLYRHDYAIAGRADKPTIETINNKRFLHIGDHKTNKKIARESFGNIKTGYVMMKGPLSDLMDCNYFHYALQLSLYQYMGEYFGFLPGQRYIIHYPHPIEGLGTPDPYKIELPYLRTYVVYALEHLKATKWLNLN